MILYTGLTHCMTWDAPEPNNTHTKICHAITLQASLMFRKLHVVKIKKFWSTVFLNTVQVSEFSHRMANH